MEQKFGQLSKIDFAAHIYHLIMIIEFAYFDFFKNDFVKQLERFSQCANTSALVPEGRNSETC